MKMLLATSLALVSMSAFASSTCHKDVVRAILKDARISEALNKMYEIKKRAIDNNDDQLADKAYLREMEINQSIYTLANNTCKKF